MTIEQQKITALVDDGAFAGQTGPYTVVNPSSRQPTDSLPLGYLAFGTTLLILAAFHAKLVDFTYLGAVFPTAIFFGGVGQLIAGMWAFRQRIAFAAVAFTAFGAFWLTYTLYLWYVLPPLAAMHGDDVTGSTGVFTLAWTFVSAFLAVAAWKVNRAVFALMSATAVMMLFITIGQFAVAPSVDFVGGIFAMIAAVIGMYVGGAYLVNGAFRAVVLPLGEGADQ